MLVQQVLLPAEQSLQPCPDRVTVERFISTDNHYSSAYRFLLRVVLNSDRQSLESHSSHTVLFLACGELLCRFSVSTDVNGGSVLLHIIHRVTVSECGAEKLETMLDTSKTIINAALLLWHRGPGALREINLLENLHV